jgi:DNA-binding MarR family transcriptional regulator
LARIDDRYDVFVSHASEDKDSFATPLALALIKLGIAVWYDDFVLQIGDKQRESIDNGLAKSEYGVIILSKNFFSKNWPQMELEGLITLSMKNLTRILPIWHGVNSDDVAAFSPMIASIRALSSSLGVDAVASKIHRVVRHEQIDLEELVQSESPLRIDEIDQSSVREIQNKRFRFLLKVYEKRDRLMFNSNKESEIGEELGYSKEVVNDITKYFTDKGYIEYPAGNSIEITVTGTDYLEDLIPNSNEVKQVRSNRIKMLKELYKHGTKGLGLDMWELGQKLGIPDESSIWDIVYYLNYKGYVSFHYRLIKVTTEGIDYIESYVTDFTDYDTNRDE